MSSLSQPSRGTKTYYPNITKGILITLLYFLIPILPLAPIFLTQTSSFIFFIIFSTFFIYLRLKVIRYELRSEGFFIKQGIISRSEVLLPYAQIQDIQERQILFDRIVGVSSLKIRTLSQEEDNSLFYLNKKDAHEIKQFILTQVANKISTKIHPISQSLSSFE